MKLLVWLMVLTVIGWTESETAAGTRRNERASRTNNFGDCSSPVDLRLDADGRKAHLLGDIRYVDAKGSIWLAPKGWVVDGASIPRAFWAIIGGPWEGKYRFASVIHDVACDEKRRRWDEAANMFYEAMRCSGVTDTKAKVMYYAVYKFGPRWSSPGVRQRAAPPRMATNEDVRAIEAFVRKKNPSLDEIRQRALTAP